MLRRARVGTAPSLFVLLCTLASLVAIGAALPTAATAQDLPEDLPRSADTIRPLLVGAAVPDAPLTASDGTATTLHGALGDEPAIVVFYRGGW